MKNTKEVTKLKLKIMLSLSLINIIIIICTSIIMPMIFNYPPFSNSNLKFQNVVEKLNHHQQYIFVFFIVTTIFVIITNLVMKNIYTFINKFYRHEHINRDEIIQIRKDCSNIPYIFYLTEIIVAWTVGIILTLVSGITGIIVIKFALLFLTILFLIGLLQFMFFQRIMNKIITLTYSGKNISILEKNTGIRIKFSTNLILQIIPFLTATIIILSLLGYAKTTEEKGNSIKNYYKAYFENRTFYSIDFENIKAQLETIPLYSENDYYIIISPNKENLYTSNNEEISNFFLTYLDWFFYDSDGRVYESYGVEKQAYMIELKDSNNESWFVGFEYSITDNSLMYFYVIVIITLFLLYTAFIYVWSRNTSLNISRISDSLENILKDENYNKRNYLPIFSNDEFGDLAYSYNKIEELTNLHLKEIQNNQDMLIEQERLASLGQMIGGIAHNLKTPIFSISGGLEGLSDLIDEYEQSIDNISVTSEDMHDIANDMREWIIKLKNYISYMSDVITVVKGQTITMADNNTIDFSVTELFKRVDILMKHEIKNSLVSLEITNHIGDENILTGNINSLVQIINNIISNAIEAYNTGNYTEKKVELDADIRNNQVIISIKDYGPGISKIAQEKLFKEMITTKGKNGTGLGMFMSYSNIKAHFNGDLTFDTEIGKGTIFFITLPLKY